MTRHEMRESAFMLTFERMFSKESNEDMINIALESEQFLIDDRAIDLFKKVDEKKDELDIVIEKYLKNWKINRISKVSLAVLRIAVYEMMCSEDIAIEIIISEAVKIAQVYTLKEDVTFVNGVLASISKEFAR